MEELQKGFLGGSESRSNNLTRQNDEQKLGGGEKAKYVVYSATFQHLLVSSL